MNYYATPLSHPCAHKLMIKSKFESKYQEITEDALKYIDGYLAKKWIYWTLGQFTHTTKQDHT